MTETMTPAEELRAAASKIRELASTVPNDNWRADGVEVTSEFFFIAEIRHVTREKAGTAAQYFALWHPGIAELVAAVLDSAGRSAEMEYGKTDAEYFLSEELALARAINGGVA